MLWQLSVNGVIASATIALVAVGFLLVYNSARFFHLAHGAVFTGGAYFAYLFVDGLGMPILIAVPMAVACATLLGCSMELGVFAVLRRKNTSSLVLLLASLGLYMVIQNLISLVFGDDIKTLRPGLSWNVLSLRGARVTSIQLYIALTTIVALFAVGAALKYTRMGKAMRAVANDPELAMVSGIDSSKVVLLSFAIGSALAGLAGVMVALDVDMTPTMGMSAMMTAIVAVIVGNTHARGTLVGALLLGIGLHIGAWQFGSQWRDTIAFVALLIFLLARTSGFFRKNAQRLTA